MEIRPIKTDEDYRATFRDIESLMGAEAGSPDGERLDGLVTLVSAYEQTRFPMDLPAENPGRPETRLRSRR